MLANPQHILVSIIQVSCLWCRSWKAITTDKQELLLHCLTAVNSYILASILGTESTEELNSLDGCDEGSSTFSTLPKALRSSQSCVKQGDAEKQMWTNKEEAEQPHAFIRVMAIRLSPRFRVCVNSRFVDDIGLSATSVWCTEFMLSWF